MSRKTINVGDVSSAIESGFITCSVPAILFSKDKDLTRDVEVDAAIRRLDFIKTREEIVDIVRYTLEAINSNDRFQRMVTMPHYAKIAEDIVIEIYNKHYKK